MKIHNAVYLIKTFDWRPERSQVFTSLSDRRFLVHINDVSCPYQCRFLPHVSDGLAYQWRGWNDLVSRLFASFGPTLVTYRGRREA